MNGGSEMKEYKEALRELYNATCNYVNMPFQEQHDKLRTALHNANSLLQSEDFANVVSVSDAKNKIANKYDYKDWKDLTDDYNGVEVIYARDLMKVYKEVIDEIERHQK